MKIQISYLLNLPNLADMCTKLITLKKNLSHQTPKVN